MSEILNRIYNTAKNYPNRVAYAVGIENDSDLLINKITWFELEDKSNRLAMYIGQKCKDKTPVVVYGHKSPLMLVSFLSCVKSGRAYVPIDSSFPTERVREIINAIEPELLIATEEIDIDVENLYICYKNEVEKIVCNWEPLTYEQYDIKSDDDFYIIFTSGSTGIPKGVRISSQAVDNFVEWASSLCEDDECCEYYHNIINQAPFSFDLSVMDIYLNMYLGGTLWSISREIQNNYNLLLKFLEMSNADIWVSTPSFVDLTLASEQFNSNTLKKMRTFLFCGETLTSATAKRLKNEFPSSKVINTYGPTESTVAVTSVEITDDILKTYNPLPIGRSKPGTEIYLLNENYDIVDSDGEIVITGNTLSNGYWKDDSKNAELFPTLSINGEKKRVYKTRDKGYLKDGYLFYSGRIDLQIKMHGYRIEIEDIESNLLRIELIENAVVVPEVIDGKVSRLVAVVVTRSGEKPLSVRKKIRTELKKTLPEYMVPKNYVFVDSLPLTNNGKVNRKKIREMLDAENRAV